MDILILTTSDLRVIRAAFRVILVQFLAEDHMNRLFVSRH